MNAAKGLLSEIEPLDLNSTASIDEAYGFLWSWVCSENEADVDLDCILVCSVVYPY